jgi:FkbM family methyltransferase
MEVKKEIKYFEENIMYSYISNDLSGEGCIQEIINNDEYNLYKYKNLSGHIIDIGGNNGLVTCILAKQNPLATIIVIEPIPFLCERIQKNVSLNNLNNVIILNKALGDGDDVKITIGNTYSGASSTLVNNSDLFCNIFDGNKQITVNSITFDQLITNNNIESIDLLKIDCEGGEYYLYDSKKFKTNIVKNITGEFHNLSYNTQLKKNWNYNDLLIYVKKYVSGDIKISFLTM